MVPRPSYKLENERASDKSRSVSGYMTILSAGLLDFAVSQSTVSITGNPGCEGGDGRGAPGRQRAACRIYWIPCKACADGWLSVCLSVYRTHFTLLMIPRVFLYRAPTGLLRLLEDLRLCYIQHRMVGSAKTGLVAGPMEAGQRRTFTVVR